MKIFFGILFLICNVRAEISGLDLRYGVPQFSFEIEGKDSTLKFEPNPLSEFTIGFLGDTFTFAIRFAVQNDYDPDDKSQVDTSYSDYLFTAYSDRYIANLYYQSFQGFHVLEDQEDFEDGTKSPQLNSTNLGANFQYFVADDFSLFESHPLYVRKPKTNGSWILGGGINHQLIEGNKKIIPTKHADDFSKIADLEAVKLDSLILNFGYAFLYAWSEIFIGFDMTLSPAFQNKELVYASETTYEQQTNLGGSGSFALAYYQPNYQFGVKSMYEHIVVEINSYNMTTIRSAAYLYFLYLF